jgi:multicomponent Na+:H+ antiporter subunit B
MTNSVFLRFLARAMMPVLLLFSLFLLLRGHNQPGGGFVGGLVASVGLILMTLAHGPDEVRHQLRVDFLRTMLYGVLIAAIAGIVGLLLSGTFLTALWWKPVIQGIGKLEFGTALVFDIGVYLAVLGVTCSIVMNMADEGEKEEE